MGAEFVFRDSNDLNYLTFYDIGAVEPGGSLSTIKANIKNIGNNVSSSTSIKAVADISFVNLINSPLLSCKSSNSSDPSPGFYNISFANSSQVQINSGTIISIINDGITENTNIISGTRIILSGTSGSSATISINDGFLYSELSLDVSGSPTTWAREVSIGNLYSESMVIVTGTLVPSGNLGQSQWYYLVTAITDLGETEISNEITINVTSANKSFQLGWSSYPGALSYNIYKGISSLGEKFLSSTGSNLFLDDGNLSINNSISYPTLFEGNKKAFWIRANIPIDATSTGNPRKFKLRAIGVSS